MGPTGFRDLMVAEAVRIFRRPSRQAAANAAVAWAKRWNPPAPWAVQQFTDVLEDTRKTPGRQLEDSWKTP